MSRRHPFLLSLALAGLLAASMARLPAAPQDRSVQVDEIFARWTDQTPGCAVGVGVGGRPVLARAYGLADLERGVVSTPETIFEAGSVSKQFTAAAVLLLARDGRLSLDDPVRRYVPELPEYDTPITIRHMLTHTSGLRDWGSLASIAGWPRGSRVHTHAHVVDILSRQQSLNFTPGTRYSYSNSGYNLAAVIVSRVSGTSFAEFSRERIFEPLGMTSTSWRDDYTRLVPGRAVAYSGGRGGGPGRGARGGNAAGRGGPTFRINMPYENVHGNGGLLTTVGDLLRWNENFVTPTLGDEAFVRQQQTVGRFTDGQAHTYAFGLRVQPYKGLPEVSHSGSTAGYRAFLTRYPDQHLSLAVLCNVSTANPTALAHAVADLYLGDALVPDAPRGAPLPATQGPRVGLERDDAYQPSADDLADFVGTYTSDEIETAVTVGVENGRLVIRRRPDRTLVLRPFSQDRFDAPQFGLVTFHRRGGRVTEFGVTQDRVWDLRFIRAAPGR